MSESDKSFGETAKGLARNPLEIIALFIVLVYGFASLVTAFAGSFSSGERLPLIYFLIGFQSWSSSFSRGSWQNMAGNSGWRILPMRPASMKFTSGRSQVADLLRWRQAARLVP